MSKSINVCRVYNSQCACVSVQASHLFILGIGYFEAQFVLSFHPKLCLCCGLIAIVLELKMSATPVARQATHTQAIPARRVLITDPSQMPDVYSSTPGGTLYSTTPGGTRIVYERSFMMSLSQSPISLTPPKCPLPAALLKNPSAATAISTNVHNKKRANSISFDESQETFCMDL